jgi:hypothetical protein
MKKECNRCLFTSDFSVLNDKQCNYCDLHDELQKQANPDGLHDMLNKIREHGYGDKYDCIMGISGGLDSSTSTLYCCTLLGPQAASDSLR